MSDMSDLSETNGGNGGNDDDFDVFDEAEPVPDDALGSDRLEEELRQAASILDPVPTELFRIAVEAYALHDLDTRIAELTFDSLVDAIPVRGVTAPPRMLTFRAGDLTVDVEVTTDGLLGQVLPPQQARIEVLSGPQAAIPLIADELGRFACDAPPAGPFALRLRTGGEVVVTQWLRA